MKMLNIPINFSTASIAREKEHIKSYDLRLSTQSLSKKWKVRKKDYRLTC